MSVTDESYVDELKYNPVTFDNYLNEPKQLKNKGNSSISVCKCRKSNAIKKKNKNIRVTNQNRGNTSMKEE